MFDSLMASESHSDPSILMEYYGNSSILGVQVPFNLALVRFPKDDHIVEFIIQKSIIQLYMIG